MPKSRNRSRDAKKRAQKKRLKREKITREQATIMRNRQLTAIKFAGNPLTSEMTPRFNGVITDIQKGE